MGRETGTPRIAFCVSCKGRVQHLKLTLPKNLADNLHYRNSVFIVLDYGSPDNLLEYLRVEHAREIRSGRLVVYSLRDAGPFKMAHAKNLAHRLGIREGADVLCNLDADNYTGPGFAQHAAGAFRTNKNIFMWARMIHRCGAAVEDGLCVLPRGHAGEHSIEQYVPPAEQPRHRGISGRIVVSADAFIKTGGYDEAKYNTWGPDDKDFNLRLQMLQLTPVEIGALHVDAIHHSPKLRFKDYPDAQRDETLYECPPDINPHTCVVNFGRFGCGTVVRNFGLEAIELKPLPTRIFGVGMHKTGTTSLQRALEILGFGCGHWTTPRWARNVWYEVKEFGTSRTLERHYAACDLPITLLFKELDAAYPGSKFILTVRDELDWLRSVRDHWGGSNHWRASWDNDCFSHQMHQHLYGRKDFDTGVFLERYRRHNTEVRAYFKDRPSDLLVMDLATQSDWHGLCHFLDAPGPIEAYPRLNVRKRGG